MAKESPAGTGSIRRVSAAVATAAVGLFLLAGCGAGQDAQTVNQRPPIDGASADAGEISIRNAGVVTNDLGTNYAKGSDALLQMVIINNGPQDEQLQSVSTPAASSAVVSNLGVPQSATRAATSDTASASASASSSGSKSPSAPSTSAAPSDSASASSSESAGTPIELKAGQSVQVGYSSIGPNILLKDLTTALYPAQTVPVTFTFSSGTTTTVDLTVQLSSNPPSAPVISEATEPTEPKG